MLSRPTSADAWARGSMPTRPSQGCSSGVSIIQFDDLNGTADVVLLAAVQAANVYQIGDTSRASTMFSYFAGHDHRQRREGGL